MYEQRALDTNDMKYFLAVQWVSHREKLPEKKKLIHKIMSAIQLIIRLPSSSSTLVCLLVIPHISHMHIFIVNHLVLSSSSYSFHFRIYILFSLRQLPNIIFFWQSNELLYFAEKKERNVQIWTRKCRRPIECDLICVISYISHSFFWGISHTIDVVWCETHNDFTSEFKTCTKTAFPHRLKKNSKGKVMIRQTHE